MTFIQKINQLDRIMTLIRRKATGSPCDLATKLGISRRSVYRLIQQLRDKGLPIQYDKQRASYCYEEDSEVKLSFKVTLDGKNLIHIKGGMGKAPFL